MELSLLFIYLFFDILHMILCLILSPFKLCAKKKRSEGICSLGSIRLFVIAFKSLFVRACAGIIIITCIGFLIQLSFNSV